MQATRILGLVADRPAGEPIQLTPYGYAFVRHDVQGQRRALRRLMLRTEPMCSVAQALIDHDGQSLDETAVLLQGMAPLAPSTAHRRVRTVVSCCAMWGLPVGTTRL